MIIDYLKESLIKEYYDNSIIYLKKYFNLTDQEKEEELARDNIYLLPTYLDEIGIDKDEIIDDEDYIDYDEVYNKNKEVLIDFRKWLYNNRHDYVIAQELPSWEYMSYRGDIKNQWLVHFSDTAQDIVSDGTFKYGVDNLARLGLTKHMSDVDKQYGGYNFAYRLQDVSKYARKRRTEYKYGSDGVIFKASGILVDHYGDEEPQVIFYGKSVTNIIYFNFNDGIDKWVIYSNKTNSPVVKFDELEDLLYWVEKNFDQYRKSIVRG